MLYFTTGSTRCGQIGRTARKYFTRIFFFFFLFFLRGESGENGKQFSTIMIMVEFLKWTFEELTFFRLEDCCRFLERERFD